MSMLGNGSVTLGLYPNNMGDNTSEIFVEEASTESDCKDFTFIVYVPIFGSICVFGLVGNTLSFIVLQWEKRNHVATFLLQTLSVVDNLFLVTTGFSQIFAALAMYFDWSIHEVALPYMQIYVWPLVHISQFLTVWMTILIAANRYIAICRPFQAPKLCTMTNVRLQVLGVALMAVLYNIPRFLEYRIVETYNPSTNTTDIEGRMSAFKENYLYNMIYENAMYCVFLFLAPLVMLTWMNVCLIRELWAARQRLKRNHIPMGGEEEENNLTLVMIIIMLIFLTCQAPALLNQLLFHFCNYACHAPYFYYFHLSNLLVSANSSTNFVVYCAFRQQFRDRMKAFCQTHRLLKHTDTWDYSGRTMSVYSKEGHKGDPL